MSDLNAHIELLDTACDLTASLEKGLKAECWAPRMAIQDVGSETV
jgi:hypothetical protein